MFGRSPRGLRRTNLNGPCMATRLSRSSSRSTARRQQANITWTLATMRRSRAIPRGRKTAHRSTYPPKARANELGAGQQHGTRQANGIGLSAAKARARASSEMRTPFWKIPPGPEREQAKQALEQRAPARIHHGPARHTHDVAAKTWMGYHVMHYGGERGSASELWARASVLQPFDQLMVLVKPIILRGVLWVQFQGEKFYVGNMPGPRDVARLITELRKREEQC
jgi:hypothetical protein